MRMTAQSVRSVGETAAESEELGRTSTDLNSPAQSLQQQAG